MSRERQSVLPLASSTYFIGGSLSTESAQQVCAKQESFRWVQSLVGKGEYARPIFRMSFLEF